MILEKKKNSNSVAYTKGEGIVYKREDGKAMGVHVKWQGMDMLVLISHSPHTDKEQAEFYRSMEEELRQAYADLALKEESKHEVIGKRVCGWMADHNMVDEPSIDSLPPGAAPHNYEAIAAKGLLASLLGATVDAYRYLNPSGRDTTHEGIGYSKGVGYASRMDAIMVSDTLMNGKQRFIHATHIPADRFQIAHRQNGEDKLKISDHKLVKITLRCSETPRPPKGFTFASELLLDSTSKALFMEVAKETLAKRVELICSVNSQGRIVTEVRTIGEEERQSRLVAAWREKSKELEAKEKEGLRGHERAVKNKLDNLKGMLYRAATEPNRISFRAQVKRAEGKYATAVYKLQRYRWKRRRENQMAEEKESSEIVHRKITPRARGTPINELRRMLPIEGKPDIESSTAGILEVMMEAWRPIFQIEYDEAA